MPPDLSVVIPAHNEELSVEALGSAFNDFVETIDFSIQLVFVDDGSIDGTIQALQNYPFRAADVKIIKLSRNYGAHAAIRAGVANADADYVMVYSMDMPEPIEDIALFVKELKAGNEIVYSKRMGYRGSLGSRIFAKLARRYIMPEFPHEGLIGVAFGPKAKELLNEHMEDNTSFFFQLFHFGFQRSSFEVKFQERKAGSSSWTFSKKLKLMIDSFVMFSFVPIRAITTLGFILAAIGFLYALVIIIIWLFSAHSLSPGFPTIISVLLIGFGLTNVSLGIISEYLVRTLEAARRRPVFIVDEVFQVRGN
ncbi:MAG: glycosyltransferase [Propionibacteriaceae bacterium]|nr:glycosyltransferase [Propionibacteriaceae bacterium]